MNFVYLFILKITAFSTCIPMHNITKKRSLLLDDIGQDSMKVNFEISKSSSSTLYRYFTKNHWMHVESATPRRLFVYVQPSEVRFDIFFFFFFSCKPCPVYTCIALPYHYLLLLGGKNAIDMIHLEFLSHVKTCRGITYLDRVLSAYPFTDWGQKGFWLRWNRKFRYYLCAVKKICINRLGRLATEQR